MFPSPRGEGNIAPPNRAGRWLHWLSAIGERPLIPPLTHRAMGLLDSEAGKRRLLTIELPVIERYNEGRDPEFKIRAVRLGSSLVLRYLLKPGHNIYQLETRLVSSYPTVPPETRVLTPLKHCPHLLEGQTLCLWRQGSTRAASRWDPSRYTCIFAIQAAWRWLACYEIWHETGEWPLPEAK